MLFANTLTNDFLALVDACIADAQFSAVARERYRGFLVQWSARVTANADTTREEDNLMLEAIRSLFTGNDLYQ